MKFSRDLKLDARRALKLHWLSAIIASFIASLLGGISSGGGYGFSVDFSGISGGGTGGGTIDPSAPMDPDTLALMLQIYNIMLAVVGIMLIAMLFYIVIYYTVGCAVAVGYAKYNVDLIDGKGANLSTLFGSFKRWFPAFGARILCQIFTFLWSLLFVIPGIIAAFSYAMVPYVLADNPWMTATEAIVESKILMRGNKWRLFCLNLSFIGWYFLGGFTFGIALIWVIPYHQAAIAAFYRDICPAKKAAA